MKLFFTGLKHSGKTTFAKLVAKHYNILVEDADDLILNKIDTSVRTFYKEKGKEAFMEIEKEVVAAFIKENENNDYILSLGGGVSDNTPLMELLKNSGDIIYLERDEKLLLDKIITTSGVPPFLDPNNIEESFNKLFTKRDAIYKNYANIIIKLIAYEELNKIKLQIINKLEKEGLSERK